MRLPTPVRTLPALLLLLALSSPAAGEWTNWRGPHYTGVSDETGLIDSWSVEGENLVWRADFVGRSTAAVFDGRACAMGRDGEDVLRQETVVCWDAGTGEKLWERRFTPHNTFVPWQRLGWAAVAGDSEIERVDQLPDGVRVASEYPALTRRYFAERGVDADVRLSYGASEAKIPDIADCVVDITETGRALRAAGLRVIDTILTSYTEVVVNPASFADPDKRRAMNQLMTLLHGALEARGKVLLKLNVAAAQRDDVLAELPAAKSPTVNQLANGDYAIETVVEKSGINLLIPALREAGATDLLEIPISKIVH